MVLRLNMRRWLLVFALSAFGNSSFAQVQIVSAEESRLPEGQVLATRAITRGPGISLSSGQEVQASSFPLTIKFELRGGVALDVASLKVEYLKQPIVDVTERVRVGMRGDSIDVAQATLPIGLHRFRVSIKDRDGRVGATLIQIIAR